MKMVLKCTNDKKDRSQEIEAALKEYGVCELEGGSYYVSGITMPDSSMLLGIGDRSRIILDKSVKSGYAVSLGSFCSIKNLTLLGDESDPFEIPDTMGKRHGIGFIGNATSDDWKNQVRDGIIDGCQIRGFSGGGITCMNTGYSSDSSLCISNCRIHYCGAGINIARVSEFHKVSNVIASRNCFGCVNNGGNNVFTGCSFDSNKVGFVMDNSDGLAKNNSHGSMVGCTINHSDNNNGVGIKIIGAKNGYVFSGCQMFYSKIEIESSERITFDTFNFGNEINIKVAGAGLVAFNGCMFASKPVIDTKNAINLKFNNCYYKKGENQYGNIEI